MFSRVKCRDGTGDAITDDCADITGCLPDCVPTTGARDGDGTSIADPEDSAPDFDDEIATGGEGMSDRAVAVDGGENMRLTRGCATERGAGDSFGGGGGGAVGKSMLGGRSAICGWDGRESGGRRLPGA